MKKNNLILAFTKSITYNIFLKNLTNTLSNNYNINILTTDIKNLNNNQYVNTEIKIPGKIIDYFNIPMLIINIVLANVKLYKYKDSILFLHTPNISFFLRAFLIFKFKKVIYFVHGFRFHKNEKYLKYYIFYLLEKILSFRTDFYIVINNEDKEIINKKFKKKFLKVNGIGIKSNYKINKKKYIKTKFNIGIIGAYRKNKGYVGLLKIAKNLLDKDITFNCYGYDYASNFYSFINKNKTHNIILNNFVDDIESKIDNFDILLHLSNREGLPVSVIQSLSQGVPVLGFNIRGVNDLIIDDFNGYLFDLNKLQDVTDKINLLYMDTKKLKVLSNNARKTINEKFYSNYINNKITLFLNDNNL